jgi:uncharacterized protein (DUF433 family)
MDPGIRGGVPVLAGTRFPVPQVLAEIAGGSSVTEVAEDFDLDEDLIVRFLEGMAALLDRPQTD